MAVSRHGEMYHETVEAPSGKFQRVLRPLAGWSLTIFLFLLMVVVTIRVANDPRPAGHATRATNVDASAAFGFLGVVFTVAIAIAAVCFFVKAWRVALVWVGMAIASGICLRVIIPLTETYQAP
jgi:hypothetical protein